MSDSTQTPDGDNGRKRPSAPVLAVLGVVAVVLVVGLVWALTNGDDTSGSDGADASASTASGGSISADPTSTETYASSTPSSTSTASASPTSPASSAKPASSKPDRVGFDEAGAPAPDVTVRITKIESVTGKAEIPGEVGGPALRITVTATNDTDEPVAINGALTNLYYGKERTPATPLLKPGSKQFPQSIPPGGTASATLVYSVPKDSREVLELEVLLDNELRSVIFSGSAA